jgi:hypothetical protein
MASAHPSPNIGVQEGSSIGPKNMNNFVYVDLN